MLKRLNRFIIGMLLLLLVLSSCFASKEETMTDVQKKAQGEVVEEKTEKILRLNNSVEPSSLHPGTAQGTHDAWILDHIFEGLTKKTPNGDIVAGMASNWQSSDGVTWLFHIKEEMQWSNGDVLTAEDFAFAWKYVLHPETAAAYAYQLYDIKGAESFNNADETMDLVKLSAEVGVRALDEQTLEITLERETPHFLELTSLSTFYPINKKVHEGNPGWALEASSYVSNGPFRLAQWGHQKNLTLVKNEYYDEKEKIHLDEVRFAIIDSVETAWDMYEVDELDIAFPLPQHVQTELVSSDNLEFYVGDDLAMYYFNLNTDVKPLNNEKVRRALAMSIERHKLVSEVTQGGQQPAFAIVPPGIRQITSEFPEGARQLFNEHLIAARNLLMEGLAEEGMERVPELTLIYNTHDGHKKIAEAVQKMWRENLGVDIRLENVDLQEKIDREHAGDYDISRTGWVGDYADPMAF